MSKNIDADLLRKEIERLRKLIDDHNYYLDNSEQALGYGLALDDIEKFLNTLSEESDKGLDVTDFCKPIDPGIAQCVADHWWEMLDSKEPDKSLKEAAEEYTQKMLESWRFDSTGCRPPRESFIAGAEWMAKQGYSLEYVIQYAWGVSDTSTESKKATLSFPLPADIFEGDRVIIQIRKK